MIRRLRSWLSIVFCLALLARSAAAQVSSARPLPVEDALKTAEITQRIPVQLSPDGRRVAFTVQYPERIEPTGDQRYQAIPRTSAGPEALGCDVWVADTDGGAAKNLTQGKGTSWGPVWSPDGRLLAFFSDRDGFSRVWLWDAATGSLRRVSDAIVRTYFNFEVLRWTSDGKRILAKVLPEGKTLEQVIDLTVGPRTEPSTKTAGPTVTVFRFEGEGEKPKPTAEPPAAGQPGYANVNLADLALLDVSTGNVRRLTRGLRPRGYWFSPDGSELAFTDLQGWTENTQQPIYDLYVVGLSDGKLRPLGRKLTMAYGVSVSWSPDGKALAYLRSGQLTPDQFVVVDARDGRERAVGEAPHIITDYQESAPVWSPDGKAVYTAGEKALGKIDVATGKAATVFSVADGDLLGIAGRPGSGRYWSPDGGRSLYLAVRNGATKKVGFSRIDLAGGTARSLFEEEAFLRLDPFSLDVSPDGRRVVYARQDATHPEDLWTAGVDFAGRRRLTRVNPALDGLTYGGTRLVEWTAGSDRLRGALLLPAGYVEGKRYPLIVNVYGGSSRSNSLFRFGLSGAGVENMQLFATRGFAMLLPDAPIDQAKHAPMSEIARTVLPGVDRVVEMGIADPERLGVMGHSYGGYSTLSLIVQTPRFKAAMASASFSNLTAMYGETFNGEAGSIGYLEKGQGDMGDTPWKVRDRYIANSPFFFLDRVQTPVLLVHGSLDIPARADETFIALRRLGKEVEYARYDGEQHWEGTWGFANQADYWKRMLEWFDNHLNRGGAPK